MTDIESLRLLTEAVETAGADIAPTYAEYVQLAFAIATDCGEAGREFFHRLCRISAKYQSAHAERMFSNALTKQQGAIHLGTAFHLAESTGVKICREDRKEELAQCLFRHTTTLGIRQTEHRRYLLRREFAQAETPWGPVRVKTVEGRFKLEYEDLRRIALEQNIPIAQVRQAAEEGYDNRKKGTK